MKIIDLRCAVIGKHPVVRIVTDEGLYGLGEAEWTKPYLKPWVLHFREALIGEDPTDVERVMLKIRQRGSFKPYGAAVSAIEHALWDIAGKAADVPVYIDPGTRRLLGVHIVGEDAAELIHVGVMVLQARGTIDGFIDAVFNFPSLSEAYKYAAYDGLGALARLRS